MIDSLERWLESHPGSEARYRFFDEGGLSLWIFTLEDPADPGPQEFSGKDRHEARAELIAHIEPAQRSLSFTRTSIPRRLRFVELCIGNQATPYGASGRRRFLLGPANVFQSSIARRHNRRSQ